MKKIFYYLIALTMVICFAAVPAFAVEADTIETVDEVVDEVVDTESESGSELTSESETDIVTEGETKDIAAIIGSAESRIDAIVKLANTMGITLEDAEALLDKMVSLGDEHFADNGFWLNIRDSIEKNPDTWTIAILAVLMLLALVIFLIRGLIKNTTAQATTRANIKDIKETEEVTAKRLTEHGAKLTGIENEHAEIKLQIDEINARCEVTQRIVDEGLKKIEDILIMAIAMTDKVDVIKENSDSALRVNVEQALETVELLNIAMGRKLPSVSESTRKVWRDNAVSKIKAFVGEDQTQGAATGEGDTEA